MFSQIAVLVASSLLVVAQLPNCARNYTVRLGDTCNIISARESVSTFQLAHVNVDVINPGCSNLAEGEPLCLGIIGQDCSTVTIVQPNDGCDTISAAANITEALLFHNNPNINSGCTNIGVGEVLCTSNQTFNYT